MGNGAGAPSSALLEPAVLLGGSFGRPGRLLFLFRLIPGMLPLAAQQTRAPAVPLFRCGSATLVEAILVHFCPELLRPLGSTVRRSFLRELVHGCALLQPSHQQTGRYSAR